MALTRRQMACFEKNPQFLDEVAAAFLVAASTMKRASMVTLSTSESTPVERAFAEIKGRVADQILQAQGINLQATTGLPSGSPCFCQRNSDRLQRRHLRSPTACTSSLPARTYFCRGSRIPTGARFKRPCRNT